jgi:hypothetical protein
MGNPKKSEKRRKGQSAKLHARFARHSKVISITRGQPDVRKLSIEREKILRDLFWQTLYQLDVLRKWLGPVIADGMELQKRELQKRLRSLGPA